MQGQTKLPITSTVPVFGHPQFAGSSLAVGNPSQSLLGAPTSATLASTHPAFGQSQIGVSTLPAVGQASIPLPGVAPAPKPAPIVVTWPVSKMRATIERGRCDRSFLAVMFLSGRLSPVHRGHLQALRIARNKLEDLGYSVVGGWLSPSHDRHCGSNDLSASLRIKLAKVATSDDSLIEVSTWESSQSNLGDKHGPAEVADALKAALSTEFPKQKDWLYVFRICGSDDYKEDMKSSDYSRHWGTVIVPRQGHAAPPEQKRALIYVASEGCGSAVFSGTAVRETISRGDLSVASVLPAGIARLITAPTAIEWDEIGKELIKLGAKAPTSIAMRETTAPKITQAKTDTATLATPAGVNTGSLLPPPPTAESAQNTTPCAFCGFRLGANAKYCAECGSRVAVLAPSSQQSLLPPPPVVQSSLTFEPGAVAKQAGIVLPPTASLQTLQALDNIIKALQKRNMNLERVFRLLDVDRSGSLQKDEFMVAMKNFTGAEVAHDELIAMWMIADANQDGKVTLEEFLAFLGKIPAHVVEAQKKQSLTTDTQPKTSESSLSPRLGHAVLEVWGILAHNVKLSKGPLDTWHVEWLLHPGSQDLMAAVAAWSPWDRHKPPQERSVRIVDFHNAIMECTDLTRNQVSSLATALGFAFDESEKEDLSVPVLAASLQRLRASIRDQEKEKISGLGGDDLPVVTGAARFEVALLGVHQLRREVKRFQSAPESSELIAAEARACDLLYLGVDMTLPVFNDDGGCTLLMLASTQGWLRFCRSLCSLPAPSWAGGIRTYINLKSDDHGWTAILCAVWNRRFEVARLLLQFQADPNSSSFRGGVTPLMLAADAGDLAMCEALVWTKADPLAKSCDSRDALNFAADRFVHANNFSQDSSQDRFRAILQLLDVASEPIRVPTEAESRKTRRRTKRVSYQVGDQMRIQWRALNGEPEILVRSISEHDRAYELGVRPGWALLLVNGDDKPLKDHFFRLEILGYLTPPVTLDFGRPINMPDDLWLEQLTNMVQTKRQHPPSWKDSTSMKLMSNNV